MPFPGLAVFLVLLFCSIGFGATKDSPPPDREMLKMMDLLRDMEMIKQLDMLHDMQHLENSEQAKTAAPQKAAPGKKREAPK